MNNKVAINNQLFHKLISLKQEKKKEAKARSLLKKLEGSIESYLNRAKRIPKTVVCNKSFQQVFNESVKDELKKKYPQIKLESKINNYALQITISKSLEKNEIEMELYFDGFKNNLERCCKNVDSGFLNKIQDKPGMLGTVFDFNSFNKEVRKKLLEKYRVLMNEIQNRYKESLEISEQRRKSDIFITIHSVKTEEERKLAKESELGKRMIYGDFYILGKSTKKKTKFTENQLFEQWKIKYRETIKEKIKNGKSKIVCKKQEKESVNNRCERVFKALIPELNKVNKSAGITLKLKETPTKFTIIIERKKSNDR